MPDREPLHLEIHLAHACNLTCDSCSHYSNYHFAGTLALETAELWYRLWSLRLKPKRVSLLGGEPTLNSQLCDHILLARRYWPETRIRLVTNGFFLYKHPRLPETLRQVGNTLLELSKHYDSDEYQQSYDKAHATLLQWRDEYGIVIKFADSFSNWTQRYIDENGMLRPFQDNNPRKSWEICSCRKCKQLYDGKLWKCPIITYLPMVGRKMRLSAEWDPYLKYQPLEANCSQDELDKFLSNEDEPVCAACPAFPRVFRKNDPLRRARQADSLQPLLKT